MFKKHENPCFSFRLIQLCIHFEDASRFLSRFTKHDVHVLRERILTNRSVTYHRIKGGGVRILLSYRIKIGLQSIGFLLRINRKV